MKKIKKIEKKRQMPAKPKTTVRVPGLTATKVRRHPPNSVATAYGHLHATRQGIKINQENDRAETTKCINP